VGLIPLPAPIGSARPGPAGRSGSRFCTFQSKVPGSADRVLILPIHPAGCLLHNKNIERFYRLLLGSSVSWSISIHFVHPAQQGCKAYSQRAGSFTNVSGFGQGYLNDSRFYFIQGFRQAIFFVKFMVIM
jgi:hypothetical protein